MDCEFDIVRTGNLWKIEIDLGVVSKWYDLR